MLFDKNYYRPFNELSRLFLSDLGGSRFHSSPSSHRVPGLNLFEDDDAYILEMAIPGISPDSIDITVEDNVLSLTGERPVPEGIDRSRFSCSERSFGKFNRKVHLPRHADRDAIRAEYENGILTITLPRAEESRPKKIEVKAR